MKSKYVRSNCWSGWKLSKKFSRKGVWWMETRGCHEAQNMRHRLLQRSFFSPYYTQIVTISDLAVFNFLFTIQRGFWGVTYVADTCLLMIFPGGSHATPPVSYWLEHLTTHRWLPPSTLLWLSTWRLYVYFSIVLPRYISQACWVASSPRLDFFRCTTVLW